MCDAPVCRQRVRWREFIWGQTWLTLSLVVETKFLKPHCLVQVDANPPTIYAAATLDTETPRSTDPAPPVWMGNMLADLWPSAQLSNSLCVDSELRCSRCPPFLSLSGPIITSGLLESGLLLVHWHKWHHRLPKERLLPKSLCCNAVIIVVVCIMNYGVFIFILYVNSFLIFGFALLNICLKICLNYRQPPQQKLDCSLQHLYNGKLNYLFPFFKRKRGIKLWWQKPFWPVTTVTRLLHKHVRLGFYAWLRIVF